MVNGVSRAKMQYLGPNLRGRRPRGFWPLDLPRHIIHHDTSKALSYNVIIIATRTSKEGFLSGWVWPMDSLGSIMVFIPGGDNKYW
jgi:hypothetical protein